MISGARDCVSFYECFRMICAFDHGSLVKDVISKIKSNNIDEKFIFNLRLSFSSNVFCFFSLGN